MTDTAAPQDNVFRLPNRLVTSVDMARVIRELQMLDDWLRQAALRSGGQAVQPPKTSATLEEVASLNSVTLLDQGHREQLLQALRMFQETAPKVHVSFAVEPSASFLLQLVAWMRNKVHAMTLLEVGLQPTLAAGCVVRTRNKYFDLSLRQRFIDSKPFLAESIAQFQLAEKPGTEAATAAIVSDMSVPGNEAPVTDTPQPSPEPTEPATAPSGGAA